MAKKEQITFPQLLKTIKQGKFSPVYLLMGEESYYIDQLTEAIIAHALDDAERDFNQTILYGADTQVATVINAAKRYPMMAARQLVVIKEAQMMDNIDQLHYYLQHPLESTILVISYKNGTLKDKKVLAEVAKCGVMFESKRLYDNQLPTYINDYVASRSHTIEPKATAMLSEAVGTNLARLSSEIEKLILSLSPNEQRITALMVERSIGISREFNSFELLRALNERNNLEANKIIKHFEKNPTSTPLVVIVAVLFNFYSNLFLLYFAPDKSAEGIKTELNLRSIYQARDYQTAMQNYNAYKCMDIISQLRKCDTRSKGIANSSASDADLLKELIYSILH